MSASSLLPTRVQGGRSPPTRGHYAATVTVLSLRNNLRRYAKLRQTDVASPLFREGFGMRMYVFCHVVTQYEKLCPLGIRPCIISVSECVFYVQSLQQSQKITNVTVFYYDKTPGYVLSFQEKASINLTIFSAFS